MLRALGMEAKLRLGRSARPAVRALRAGKRLRGRSIDPFGRSELRHLERDLRDEYMKAVDVLIDGLSRDTVVRAAEIAALPDSVRGYENLKLKRAVAYRTELKDALATYP